MTMTHYPVQVDAELDPQVSRWQWIFKWLLALPHYVVLAFLWAAFVVLSVVAFFAVLLTGRYPRSVFEFNVGVLRWSWRVAYYAYGALGTDRYPPFTLRDVPTYPAHLEVDYPERLSRGLVLIKWWLLALPHYLVLGLLLGGAGYAVRGGTEDTGIWGAGLIGLLVLVAGVTLLVTGRYPQRLFDLIIGLNRWVLRVAGYAALMTDRYPPFSLDQGGHEQPDGETSLRFGPATPAPAAHAEAVSPGQGWTTGAVVSVVLGSVLALTSLGIGAAGAVLVAADATARDDAGFLMSPAEDFATTTYAITTTSTDVHLGGATSTLPQAVLGEVKLTASPLDGGAVFVGIARTSAVETYLAGVEHARLVGIDAGEPDFDITPGAAPSTPPADQGFWAAQVSGSGDQELTWPVENGEWTVVVMRADASSGVAAEISAGAEVPALSWLIAGLLVTAGLLLLVATLLIAVPVARTRPTPPVTRSMQTS